jgi:hypothetical protein
LFLEEQVIIIVSPRSIGMDTALCMGAGHACWARVRECNLPDDDLAPLWRHAEMRDTWRGALAHGLPEGQGIYNFHLTKLCLGGTVLARARADDLVFGCHASASWPDGAHYEGELTLSKMHGSGLYVFPNGDVYEGEWKAGRRHGDGTLCSWIADSALLRVEALGPGRRAYALRCCGAWEDNVFSGQVVMEFFDAPPGAARETSSINQSAREASKPPVMMMPFTCNRIRRLSAGRELRRRFERGDVHRGDPDCAARDARNGQTHQHHSARASRLASKLFCFGRTNKRHSLGGQELRL